MLSTLKLSRIATVCFSAVSLLTANVVSAYTIDANEVLISNKTSKSKITEPETYEDIEVKEVLMARLKTLSQFSAEFEQKVIDNEGNLLIEGKGKLSVQTPNLIHWETSEPEESLIVSDGEDLWLYDPFVEQATVYNLSTALAQTPILLLTSSDENMWQQYNVTSDLEGQYIITATNNSQVKSLTLNFDPSNNLHLNGFTILDATGQQSIFVLNKFDRVSKPNTELFKFTLPEGNYLDDQR